MKRAGATVLIGLTGLACALALVGVGASCSTFGAEEENEAGPGSNPEAGTDAQADGSSRADSADTPDVDTPEEEDGGDAGTVVVSLCAAAACRLVFVTAAKVTGSLSGAAGADVVCNNEAQKNPTLASRTFKAWISEAASSAESRLSHAAMSYRRLDGVLVASDWNDLVDGNLAAPINVDQFGSVLIADVWTGTNTAGQPTAVTCNNWRAFPDGGFSTGTAGRTERTDGGWTMGKTYPCGTSARLYCIESP